MSNEKRDKWLMNFLKKHKGETLTLNKIYQMVPKGHRIGIGIISTRSLCQILKKYHIKKKLIYSRKEGKVVTTYSI